MRRISLSLLCLLLGCSENFVNSKLTIPAFQKSPTPPQVTRAGVAIRVLPLGHAELESGKVPTIKVKWREIDHSQVAQNGKGGAIGQVRATSMHEANIALIPLPSFAVAIENHSSAPIDMSKARITLVGSSGRKYPALLNPEDIASRVEVLVRDRYPYAAQEPGVVEQVRGAVVRVPFVATSTTIAPEARFDGVLVFDMKVFDFKELYLAFANETKFEVQFENLGGDAQPLSISVELGTTQTTITASCAEGKPATAQSCHFATN